MFLYNNAINASTDYILFKFNYRDYSDVFFEKEMDSCFYSKIVQKLVAEFEQLLAVYCENFHYT